MNQFDDANLGGGECQPRANDIRSTARHAYVHVCIPGTDLLIWKSSTRQLGGGPRGLINAAGIMLVGSVFAFSPAACFVTVAFWSSGDYLSKEVKGDSCSCRIMAWPLIKHSSYVSHVPVSSDIGCCKYKGACRMSNQKPLFVCTITGFAMSLE